MINLIVMFLLFAFASACSVKDDMDSMHQSTVDMNQTTHDMRDVTGRMEQKTSEMQQTTAAMAATTERMAANMEDMLATTKRMAETTENLHAGSVDTYQDLRHGSSAEMRLSSIEKMKSAKSQAEKITYAAHFVRAFDFQLWKAHGRDDEAKLQTQRDDAVNEYMRIVKGICMDLGSKLTTSPLSQDPRMQDLYALATVLHIMDTDDPHLKTELDRGIERLLEDGLNSKKELESDNAADLPAYKRSVLRFEDHAVFIIELRQNFLAAMMIGDLVGGRSASVSFIKKLSMALRPWSAPTANHNTAEIHFFNELLAESVEARSYLRQLGYPVELHKSVRRVLKHMRVNEVAASESQRGTELEDLRNNLQRLLSGDVEQP